MQFPRFALVEQSFPNRTIPGIPRHIHAELSASNIASGVAANSRIAIGVGSRGISNIATIVKAVVDFWKAQGTLPFLFPAMGSHGAATAEGQSEVLAHYGIHEATMGVPVVSSLDVVSQGKTPEGIETFIDKSAFESDGVFLVGRVKWHTDFSGSIESGLFKMMAIGMGKFAGARTYHTHACNIGLEKMIRSVGKKVFASGKMLGGLAIQEGAHHETAGLVVVSAKNGCQAMLEREEELLTQVKSWKANLPVTEVDILIVDEMGKNISGAGMDTKVINRCVTGESNMFPDVPRVGRVYVRGLTSLTYGSAVGVGLAEVIHNRLLEQVDWKPTYINSLTASTPTAIRTPIHFPTDAEALEAIAPTVGKLNAADVTYCRIRNTLELADVAVSENLIPALVPGAKVASEPFSLRFDAHGDFEAFPTAIHLTDQPVHA